MSKFGCTCGHVIRDQTDNLPYRDRCSEDTKGTQLFSRVLGPAAVWRSTPQVSGHERLT